MIENRAGFGKMLNELSLANMAAEVGVYRGEFSKVLMDSWCGRRLHLIDPWEKMEDYSSDSVNDGDRNSDYIACRESLREHSSRVSYWRLRSDEAAACFSDGALDFIYIDANHNEEFVRQDLALWYPKAHSGGVFAGHDYLSTVTWPGVQKAVNEFAESHGIKQINLTWEPGGSWWWVKP